MSSAVQLQPLSFPSQSEIAAYFDTLPYKKAMVSNVDIAFPESIEKVSKFFANQTMNKNEIAGALEKIFHYEQLEGFPCTNALEGATKSFAVPVYDMALTDVAEKAWYTAPPPGETAFVRHVEQVNKT
jgi:hypothetical protein